MAIQVDADRSGHLEGVVGHRHFEDELTLETVLGPMGAKDVDRRVKAQSLALGSKQRVPVVLAQPHKTHVTGIVSHHRLRPGKGGAFGEKIGGRDKG